MKVLNRNHRQDLVFDLIELHREALFFNNLGHIPFQSSKIAMLSPWQQSLLIKHFRKVFRDHIHRYFGWVSFKMIKHHSNRSDV